MSAEPAKEQTRSAPGGAAPVRAGVVIAVLVVAAFTSLLNETVLSVALRTLSTDLNVPATTVQWLTSAFLLTMATVIPTTGYLLQRFSPRTIFTAAMSLFSVGTLVSGLAPGFEVLLLGRVVQAAGTALMIPLLMTTIMRLVPAERRGSTMGTITIVIAAAPAVGPTVGGTILDHLGWRWLFLCILPVALVVLALGARLLRLPSAGGAGTLDVGSVLLSAFAFSGIVYGLATISEPTTSGVPPVVLLVGGLVLLALFVWRQVRLQRDDRPLLDLRPFADRNFRVIVGMAAAVFMILLGAGAVLLPLYLQTALGITPASAGLAVLPGGVVLALLGRPIGMLYDRIGPRPLVIPGSIIVAAAMWTFGLLADPPLAAVIATHVALMAGLGCLMTPLLTTALGSLPSHLYSHGSAIITTLQQVAGAAATAGLIAVATGLSGSPGSTPDAAGLRGAFVVAGCLGLVAVILSFLVRRPSPAPEAPATPTRATTTTRAAKATTTLRGQVVTPTGNAAVVTVVDVDGRQRGHTRTDGGGYEIDLPEGGVWCLIVSSPGAQPQASRVTTVGGADTVAPDVTLTAHRIAGSQVLRR